MGCGWPANLPAESRTRADALAGAVRPWVSLSANDEEGRRLRLWLGTTNTRLLKCLSSLVGLLSCSGTDWGPIVGADLEKAV